MNRRLILSGAEWILGVITVYCAARLGSPALAALVSSLFLGRIFQARRSVEILARLARTDDLTDLPNDRSFREQLARKAAGLILFDVDQFKSFNDTFGHPAGDDVLRQIATILAKTTTVYRLGGDEFAVILNDPDPAASLNLAGLIQLRIRNYDWPLRPITASFGLAMTAPAIDPGELRLRADRALYQAKSLGGNRICVDQSDS